MTLEAGRRGTLELVVGDADTAIAFGPGDVPVLATPRVLALLEAATVAAMAGVLEPGSTTVGSRVELRHEAPTAIGATVRAEAELTEVAGRRLTFTTVLTESGRPVARATVTRVIVDRANFGG